jgi:prevent-host-death family protein
MKATAKDLRFYSKELLESVNRGEEVVITYRGKPYAKLVPFREKEESSEDQKHNLFGIWNDREDIQDVDSYLRNIRKGRY